MTEFKVREHVETYLRHAIGHAKVSVDSEHKDCKAMVSKMIDAYMAHNAGLNERINKSIETARNSKKQQITKTWKKRVRKPVNCYCRSLYDELDYSDVYLTKKSDMIDCSTVLLNEDCIVNASAAAKVKAKKSKIFGFEWFSKSAA